MSQPEVWTGVVSGAESSHSVSRTGGGYRNGRYNRGSTSTTHHLNLLLDGRPVLFSANSPAQLRDGDQAVLGGKLADGVLKASVYRNLTTGAQGKGSGTLLMVLGVLFVLVGIPFSFLLIGIPFVLLGGFLIWLSLKHGKLVKAVDAVAAQVAVSRPTAAAQPAAGPAIVS